MALLPPEFLAAVLLAFMQLRLRAYFSLATWILNGLTFFLPPEDELIATLNGQPFSKTTKGGKMPVGQPLSAAEKMDKFYVRVAKTSSGVFDQTLFFELYEMLVVLVSSASIGCWIGSVVSFTAPWFNPATGGDDKVDVGTYGLISAMLVSLWFPLQLNFAQGWAGYESRLGLAVGFIGLILSGFIILSPQGWFDFDLEHAVHLIGVRVEILLRAVGLTDADFVNIAPLAEMARVSVLLTFSLFAGIFTCTTFLPSFRFTRMYFEMIKDKRITIVMKLFLHLNMFLPVLMCILWMPSLSSAVLVPSELVKCSPRALARDCLQDEVLGLSNSTTTDVWKWYSLTESQFHTLRVYVVYVACLVRLICFRTYLQRFLLEPREVMASHVGRPGLVDGTWLQNKVRLQFNYVPIIALQYLAPVFAILVVAQLLMRQTATSLGIFKGLVWVLRRLGPNISIPAYLTWENLDAGSLNVLPDPTAPPDLGGFRLGKDLTKENVAPFLRGMSQYLVLTAEFYDSALGFVIWFLSFTMVAVSIAGLLYWRNATAQNTNEVGQAIRQNKQTPKKLKNQLKSLKFSKKNK
ncbi:Predicted membrane protein [Plasmopara halstedii]|uniref:Predicted membrane protein n=1 Tax=Plasmopara halstedii TaxID=4781 RepID=A0A0P1AS74_PLAHL|nr:Predicted membrane protein [Plasmopara halstedii]CEG44502.1 Predicted membrane protein [Plasmopara halstedii]|eukprot:XP_024580871.1 Predicted membrane protein [Plasmopara halstedii]